MAPVETWRCAVCSFDNLAYREWCRCCGYLKGTKPGDSAGTEHPPHPEDCR